MINDCKPEPGIIRDYFKLTDAQLEANVLRGYEEAIIEKKRREGNKICPHTTSPIQLRRLCRQCRKEINSLRSQIVMPSN